MLFDADEQKSLLFNMNFKEANGHTTFLQPKLANATTTKGTKS
jgi:hypothetical protein